MGGVRPVGGEKPRHSVSYYVNLAGAEPIPGPRHVARGSASELEYQILLAPT